MAEPAVLVETPPPAKEAPKAPAGLGAPSKMIVIAVLGGSVVLGAGLGSFLIAPRFLRSAPEATEAGTGAGAAAAESPASHESDAHGGGDAHGKKKKGGHEAQVFEIDNIIVNPAGAQGTHFLMASVAFEVPDPKTEEFLRMNEVRVRDMIVATLGAQSLDMLSQPHARDSLKVLLSESMQQIIGAPQDLEVYLPQFVVQ
jgi:flagellar basal body-associated protein FliL